MKGKKTIIRKYYKNYTQTFNASSSFQIFTVPEGVKKLLVDCVASKGLDGNTSGGNGGRVQCIFPVVENSIFYIYVGDIPSTTSTASYNASDIRTDNTGVTDSISLSSRIIVAGGGGNGSSSKDSDAGGAGGGLTGGSVSHYGGGGGTQTSGGSRGSSGNGCTAGTFGLGGNGYSSGISHGGAGGAGWYGGGGGGYNNLSFKVSGGGGGSSYTDSFCYEVVHTQGYNNGTGYITITYAVESTESDYDFYRDFYEVKVIKETINNEDKFYGVKEYKRGQYYGN